MSGKISRVIESKLKFLKLTRTGKISLTIFKDKILFKALSKLQRSHGTMPKNPFNTYYAYCLSESKRLELEPDWTTLGSFPNYNTNGDATEFGEKFDMGKCQDIMAKASKKSYGKKGFVVRDTFNQDAKYWKYGQWHKYPDQALSDESDPCKEDPTWKPRLPQNDPSRLELNQLDELRKAIRSGKINKKGLRFLRETYLKTKPEIVSIIDAYLEAGEEKDENTQAIHEEPIYTAQNLPF